MTTPPNSSATASVNVDGTAVDPCSVIAASPSAASSEHTIEVCIPTAILLHELQQSGVDVSERTLADFVAADARDERARDGYLTIARFVIAPLPRQRRFLGIFALPSRAHHVIAPRWAWTESSGAEYHGDTIVLSGRAVIA